MRKHDASPLLLLGYPIDTTRVELLEEKFAEFIERYQIERRPFYATTLKSIYFGQLSGCNLNNKTSIQISNALRRADFLGLDSKFLMFLCRLLGNSTHSLVTPEDLLHASASYAVRTNQSIYLIAHDLSLCKQTGHALKEDYPGLKIAGYAAPSIHTKGIHIETSCERDSLIVDTINITKPALLVMDLGHPKQEIWFERIKEELKVPLSIGVAGAFEEYLNERLQGENSILPKNRTQKKWQSYLHYICWITPLFLYSSLNRIITKLFYKKSKPPYSRRYLFLSEKESLAVIPFPSLLNDHLWSKHPQWVIESLEHDHMMLDFQEVHHLDLAALGLLFKMRMETERLNKNLFILGVCSDVKTLLKLHGIWDLIEPLVVQNPDEILDRMSTNLHAQLKYEREFISIHQTNKETHLSFFGRINKMETPSQSLHHLEPILDHRTCVVNLKYCTSIPNQGFAFLLRLQKLLQTKGSKLVLSDVNKSVWKEIKFNKLDSEFLYQ